MQMSPPPGAHRFAHPEARRAAQMLGACRRVVLLDSDVQRYLAHASDHTA